MRYVWKNLPFQVKGFFPKINNMSKRSLSEEPEDLSTDSKRLKIDLSTEVSQDVSFIAVPPSEHSTTLDSEESSQQEKSKFGLSDVLLVEHAVGLLQTGLKTILDNAPTEYELAKLKSDPETLKVPEIILALNRSKLLLASKLKTLHQDGRVGIFDNIINFEKDLVIDQKQVKVSIIPEGRPLPETSNNDHNGMPPIPEIKNTAIKAQVFMHKSVIKQKLFLSDRDAMSSHNERLEFIGDSFLNTIMTQIIVNEFPYATEGELSLIRTKLVNNNVLQKWSQLYGLDKKLKMVVDDSVFKGKLKIYADVFEAYVGGLILENPSNYAVVHEWLSQLAKPIMKEFRKIQYKSTSSTPPSSSSTVPQPEKQTEMNNIPVEDLPLNSNAKVDLYSLIGYAKLGLQYVNIGRVATGVDNIIIFTVQVKTKDGDILGEGKGKNIKEAGARAAMAALANKPLIEKYSLLRASIPRELSTKPADFEKSNVKFLKSNKRDGSKAIINSEDHRSKFDQLDSASLHPEGTTLTGHQQKNSGNLNQLLDLLKSKASVSTFEASNNSSTSSSFPTPTSSQTLPSPFNSQTLPPPKNNNNNNTSSYSNRNKSNNRNQNNGRSNGYSRPRNNYSDDRF